jgi:hypothetical protein
MRAAGMCGDCAKSNSSSVLIRGRCASCMRSSIDRRSRSSTSACSRASRVVQMRVVALGGLFGERSELRSDGRESQRLRVLRDACGVKACGVRA